jgi:hypothetical protein
MREKLKGGVELAFHRYMTGIWKQRISTITLLKDFHKTFEQKGQPPFDHCLRQHLIQIQAALQKQLYNLRSIRMERRLFHQYPHPRNFSSVHSHNILANSGFSPLSLALVFFPTGVKYAPLSSIITSLEAAQ